MSVSIICPCYMFFWGFSLATGRPIVGFSKIASIMRKTINNNYLTIDN